LSRATLFQHEKDDLVEEPCPMLKPRLVMRRIHACHMRRRIHACHMSCPVLKPRLVLRRIHACNMRRRIHACHMRRTCPVLKPRLVFQDTAGERFNTLRPICNGRIGVLLQQVSAYVSVCHGVSVRVSVCVYVYI
jgi:hypothetical protein